MKQIKCGQSLLSVQDAEYVFVFLWYYSQRLKTIDTFLFIGIEEIP